MYRIPVLKLRHPRPLRTFVANVAFGVVLAFAFRELPDLSTMVLTDALLAGRVPVPFGSAQSSHNPHVVDAMFA